MLISLSIKNLAIIDNIQIDFKDKMTAITGLAGSGKSLIIDAIGLLFGDRASSELVRTGENKAYVEGIFCDYSLEINKLLTEWDIFDDSTDNLLIIKREIYSTGKSICKINGQTVTNANLSIIANLLGDIHTQFDTLKLISPKNYFDYIDDKNIKNVLIDYRKALQSYNYYFSEYNYKLKNKEEVLSKLDFMKYQLNELENAKLDENEYNSLKEKFEILKNHEKIFDNYLEFVNIFKSNNILDNIFNSINYLEKNIKYSKDLQNDVNRLQDNYYEIKDIYDGIVSILNHDDFSVTELDKITDRISLYNDLTKKYHKDINELIEYKNKLSDDIKLFNDYDFLIKEIKDKVDEAYDNTMRLANEITNLRKNNIKKLEEELIANLNDLQMSNVSIDICINKAHSFTNNGIDDIDFLVSFNKGEKLSSLSKVASGGELSRFMLSLKAVSASNFVNKTYVFDEIDSGVSGEIAFKIGEKMKTISLSNQVICVTHLPQVAAMCDNHLYISKVNENDRIKTKITYLNEIERENTIALMLSKGNITDASIVLARELLKK